ncbi:MAG: hypothetical protein EG823_03375 [Actinobacteria bacterium]|nr:hypothetical protein [Actinomycetota bacterium]
MSALKSARTRTLATIAAGYTLAWGLMLLNGGRYWDDWVMVALSPSGARLMGSMAGQPWQPYLWLTMSWLPGAEYLVHVLTFACFLGAALLLNRILARTPGVSPSAQLLVPLLFAVFPVNAARIAHIDFQYSLSIAAFYLAWYLAVADLDAPRPWRRIAAASAFVFALATTNSLMVFIALPVAHIAWLGRDALRDRAERPGFLARNGYIIVLPVGAWALKTVTLEPWGLYVGYNELGLTSGLKGLLEMPASLRSSLFEPLVDAWPALAAAVPAYLWLRRGHALERGRVRESVIAAVLGAVALVLGVAPYLAVGKVPQMVGLDSWDSRHQLLVPLGAALLLFGVVSGLVRLLKGDPRIALAVLLALSAAFVVADARIALVYQADWYKQVALMGEMEASKEFSEGNYFIVADQAVHLNALDRRYLPYELSGMMYRVFGTPTRFAWDEELGAAYAGQLTAYMEYEQYHWSEWTAPARTYRVTIMPGTTDVTDLPTLLALMWQQRFDRETFERRIGDVLDVEAEPAPPLI